MLRPPEDGGFGMDAMWNDDLHHAAMVALTGRKEAYYTDYHGNPQEFVSAAKYGFLYQGQRYKWQKKPRGTPTFGLPPAHFVNFIQNHDQIANSGLGQRIHKQTSPGRLRAMTAYILLLPGTPMLFMGQEFAASAPFLYFADNPPDLAETVEAGRKEFLQQFRSLATPEMQEAMPAPADPSTFRRCKLDPDERERHGETLLLHTDLLRLRRDDPVLRRQMRYGVDGACLGPGTFVLRFFGDGEDRLMLVNLEVDLHLDPAPEPLLAPPPAATWEVMWSSEDPAYGGSGTPAIYSANNWLLPGCACVVMRPVAARRRSGRQQVTQPHPISEECQRMADAVRVLTWDGKGEADPADPPEWLVGNGLGGFASGTVTGIITRRYHGLLIAALPVPFGRTVMLDGISETVERGDGRPIRLGADQIADEDSVADAGHLKEFRLELGLPVWRFAFDGIVLERRLVVLHEQNTVLLSWRLIEAAAPVSLSLRPFNHVRPLDGRVSEPSGRTYRVISQGDRHEIAGR